MNLFAMLPVQLSLRDLMWLVLLVAAIVAARREHRQGEQAAHEALLKDFGIRMPRSPQPNPGDMANRELRRKLARLDDDELAARLEPAYRTSGYRDFTYEYLLSEMVQRGMTGTLAKHYEQVKEGAAHDGSWGLDNLVALTALRRSAGEPDPLFIRASAGFGEVAVMVHAELQNADVKRESLGIARIGNFSDQWRVLLTDGHGREVARSNYMQMSFGGIVVNSRLEFGDKLESRYHFNIKQYVAPPPSGIYQLRLLYHNHHELNELRDIEGLIYSQSPPITVRVRNHSQDERKLPLIPIVVGVIALSLFVVIGVFARWQRNALWRDALWCAAMVVATAMWYADQQRLQTKRLESRADVAVDWTIEAVRD